MVEVRSSTAVLIKGFTLIPLGSGIEAGAYIWGDCDNCTVIDNVIANFSEKVSYAGNQYGIRLDGTNCKIVNNTFVNDGLVVLSFSSHIVSNNTVNGKPLVYLHSMSNSTIDGAGEVILINCNNMQVKDNNLSYATVGVELWGTNNSCIIGNNITNNTYGIIGGYSSNNSIIENSIVDNIYGTDTGYASNNNFIKNNMSNNFVGVYVYSCLNSNIGKNDLRNNEYGVYAYLCSNSNVTENDLRNNGYGVYWYGSSNNKVCHNNFRDSVYTHAYSEDNVQTWDDGYPSGGNYWSGYINEDLKEGPNQDINGSDGIWDKPYIINDYNKDRYPFVNPWPPTAEPDFEVSVTPASRAIYSGQSTDYTVNITSLNGFNSCVSLSLSGLPANASHTFAPEQITPPTNGTAQSILQVSTELSAVPGIYSLSITGSSNETTHSMNVTLKIMESIPPVIDIVSPENTTYSTSTIPLTFTINEPTSWIGYSLDGQANVTITGNATLTGLDNGTHNITVYAIDIFGNTGSSNTVYFTVLVIVHDVTVLSVNSSSNEVDEGDLVNITVVVRNNGNVAETFNVTAFANDTIIQTQTILDLGPYTETNLTFTWNTTGFALGNYIVKVETSTIPGETHVTDNIKIYGTVNMIPELTSLFFIPLLLTAILTLIHRKGRNAK